MRILRVSVILVFFACSAPPKRIIVPVPSEDPIGEIDASKIKLTDCDAKTPPGRIKLYNETPDQFRASRSCMCVKVDFSGLGFNFLDEIYQGRILDHKIVVEKIPGGTVIDDWLTFYELKMRYLKRQTTVVEEEGEVTVTGDMTYKPKPTQSPKEDKPTTVKIHSFNWDWNAKSLKQNVCVPPGKLLEGDMVAAHIKFTYVEPALVETCYKEQVSCPSILAKPGEKAYPAEMEKALTYCAENFMDCAQIAQKQCYKLQENDTCPRRDQILLKDNRNRFNALVASRRKTWEEDEKMPGEFNHEYTPEARKAMQSQIDLVNKQAQKQAEGSDQKYEQAASFGSRMYYREIKLLSKPVYLRIDRRNDAQ